MDGGIVVLLLVQLLRVALDAGQHLAAGLGAASGEPVLEDELDDVADLGSDEAIDGKLKDLLPIKGGLAGGAVVLDELDDQVGRDLYGQGLKGEAQIEGATHGEER